jgi:hypothetical protein
MIIPAFGPCNHFLHQIPDLTVGAITSRPFGLGATPNEQAEGCKNFYIALGVIISSWRENT